MDDWHALPKDDLSYIVCSSYLLQFSEFPLKILAILLVGLKITCLVRCCKVEALRMLPNLAWIGAFGECTTLMLCSNRFICGSDIPFPMSSSQPANTGLVALIFWVKINVFWLKAGQRELILRHAATCSACVPLGTIGRVRLQYPPSIMLSLQKVSVFYRDLAKNDL